MALSVLDGNQSATTLSSVVTGGEHVVAHSVVSLGSNAISNITTAVSGSVVTIPTLNILARSVATDGIADSTLNFVKIGGHQDGSNQTAHIVHVSSGGAMKVDASDSTVTFGAIRGTVTIGNTVTIAGTVTANPTGTQTIAGTVTAGNLPISPFAGVNAQLVNDESQCIGIDVPFQVSSWNNDNIPISGVVTVSNIQTVTLGSPLVNTTKYPTAFVGYDGVNGNWQAVPLSEYGACVIVGNSSGVFHASNPLPISGTVTANTFALQGTAVTTSNFTSTTASTVLANYNATREVLTIFNEGAGNLHICAGATCTTIAYQVRLSAGDYYEVPNHQTTITHSAVFATAGTARVTQVS